MEICIFGTKHWDICFATMLHIQVCVRPRWPHTLPIGHLIRCVLHLGKDYEIPRKTVPWTGRNRYVPLFQWLAFMSDSLLYPVYPTLRLHLISQTFMKYQIGDIIMGFYIMDSIVISRQWWHKTLTYRGRSATIFFVANKYAGDVMCSSFRKRNRFVTLVRRICKY